MSAPPSPPPHEDSVKSRARKKIERDMGQELMEALRDEKTVEIVLNADGWVWLEQLGQPMRRLCEMRPSSALAIIETVAGYHGKEVTKLKPLLEGEFPIDGSRFAAQIPPVVPSPTFAIRKKAVLVFTFDDYVNAKIMTEEQVGLVCQAVDAHKNILVIGGTGSGKTTLVNTIIRQMVASAPDERVVIIEDTGEIQCEATNFVQYHTSPEVAMTDLLRATLRMRPDRILVGEVRGPEALDLLMAWNTGHPGGAATLHANSAQAGLDRLQMLISMNPNSPRPIQPLIGEAVDVLVHIARTPDRARRVNQIMSVSGYIDGQYILQTHL